LSNPEKGEEPYDLPDDVTSSVSSAHDVTIAHLPAITSRASSLGARSPAPGVVRLGLDRKKSTKGGLTVVNVPDELAMRAAVDFAGMSLFLIPIPRFRPCCTVDEHKILVELASSVTLTPVYSYPLFQHLFPERTGPTALDNKTLVFIVCGGFKISLSELFEYREHLGKSEEGDEREAYWDVGIDGEVVLVPSGSAESL